jgi:predicted Na+-dependent transporter
MMIFIRPMWDHETERIGMKKCSHVGYTLHCLADLSGFTGLLLFFASVVYSVYQFSWEAFRFSMFWLIGFSIVCEILSILFYYLSKMIAKRKGFRYDPEKCIATWEENGKTVMYKWHIEINE